MRTLRTFALGMGAGALLLYVLLWRAQALALTPLGRSGPGSIVPARPPASAPAASPSLAGVTAPSPSLPTPTAPAREPGGSTDDWIPHDPNDPLGAARPDVAFQPAAAPSDMGRLQSRQLGFPVAGYDRHQLRDNFAEMRGTRVHEAIDMLAARGTPVLAVDEGTVAKLFNSKAGGLTVYEFDHQGAYCYYYAHLDRYAEGLKEGQILRKGETIGYVGTTGNAPPTVPHLHFTIFKLGPEKRWWEGVAINPFALWALP